MAKSFEEIRELVVKYGMIEYSFGQSSSNATYNNDPYKSKYQLDNAIKELCDENERLKQKAIGFEMLYEDYKDKHFFVVEKILKLEAENEALKKQLRELNI